MESQYMKMHKKYKDLRNQSQTPEPSNRRKIYNYTVKNTESTQTAPS